MSIIGTVIGGAVVGAIGKFIMPGKDPGGIVVTTLLGIAGSVLMGFLGQLTGWYQAGQGAGWIASIIGVLVLLFGYRQFRGGSPTG